MVDLETLSTLKVVREYVEQIEPILHRAGYARHEFMANCCVDWLGQLIKKHQPHENGAALPTNPIHGPSETL